MPSTKIIIAGIGGVGGYFGGLLAKHFYKDPGIEICFLARGANLTQIKTKGLKIIHGKKQFIAHPSLATDNAGEIGTADFIILCTKAYDLEDTLTQLAPCIHPRTVILPLLNGVDSRERIIKMFPGNLTLEGCVYIVSRLKEPGLIENSGNVQTLYFGLDHLLNNQLTLLENLFLKAGIEVTRSEKISTIVWEKFIFISPTATATSYYDKTIGELVADKNTLQTVRELLEEIKQVATAKQIPFSTNISENVINRLTALPFGTTSSMHSDFLNHKSHTELESLTGYVVKEAKKYRLAAPAYSRMYEQLRKMCESTRE